MNKDYTHVTLLVDRSGSMASLAQEASYGINKLIQEQKEKFGKCTISLIEFDNHYNEVCTFEDIKNVSEYKLKPGFTTALLDSIGKSVKSTGDKLASMKEEDRPALVIFAITTDGYENASREFKQEQIKEMIEHQQTKYNWQFSFIAANQDSFLTANNLGIDTTGVTNVSVVNYGKAYDVLSNKTSRMRSACVAGNSVDNSYSVDEIKSLQ